MDAVNRRRGLRPRRRQRDRCRCRDRQLLRPVRRVPSDLPPRRRLRSVRLRLPPLRPLPRPRLRLPPRRRFPPRRLRLPLRQQRLRRLGSASAHRIDTPVRWGRPANRQVHVRRDGVVFSIVVCVVPHA